MTQKNIKTEHQFIIALIIFSFLTRLITIYYIRDFHFDNEWGVLLNNLINHNGYSFHNFNGEFIPSAYMPPLYPFFLYLIKIITSFENSNLLFLIYFIQIMFSTISVYLFYLLNKNFFSKKISGINSFFFSIFPINIYVCGQISSINLQVFFSILFLYLLFLIIKKNKNGNIILFSTVSGLLILTRGEFILIFLIILFFILLNKKIKLINFVKIVIIVLLIISPYIVRNYLIFNEVVIVKSLGFNLWKGNNQLSSVEGYENFSKGEFAQLKLKMDNVKKDKYYEINRDNIFLEEAKRNLINDPFKYTNLFFKKLFSYYFVNFKSNYPDYYNIFHFLPALFLGAISFPGFIISLKKRSFESNILLIYLIFNLLIFSFFFILPRYKLITLPIQIMLASHFINYLYKRITKN